MSAVFDHTALARSPPGLTRDRDLYERKRGKKARKRKVSVARGTATAMSYVEDECTDGACLIAAMGEGAGNLQKSKGGTTMDRLTRADGMARVTAMRSHLYVHFEIHDKATSDRVAAHMGHMCDTFWRGDEGCWMGAPTDAWSVDAKHIGYLANMIRFLFEPDAVILDPRLAAHASAFQGPAPFQKP